LHPRFGQMSELNWIEASVQEYGAEVCVRAHVVLLDDAIEVTTESVEPEVQRSDHGRMLADLVTAATAALS